MKKTKKARDLRTDEALRRKAQWARGGPAAPGREPAPSPAPDRTPRPASADGVPASRPLTAAEQAELEAADALEFLAYLEKDIRVVKEEEVPAARAAGRRSVGVLNLEAGMPTVEEAIRRMCAGLQEMRSGGVRVVRLIHGYGSTGRGGRLRISVRAELGRLKRSRRIADFVPGEDFGPFGEAGRRLADRWPEAARDPDWGKDNQGITMVLL